MHVPETNLRRVVWARYLVKISSKLGRDTCKQSTNILPSTTGPGPSIQDKIRNVLPERMRNLYNRFCSNPSKWSKEDSVIDKMQYRCHFF